MVCIFSPVTTVTTPRGIDTQDTLLTPQQPSNRTFEWFQFRFPLLRIKNGQVGYEIDPYIIHKHQHTHQRQPQLHHKLSLQLELKLFSLYFKYVHPAFPVLLKQSVLNIHNQDRLLLARGLRYAIMTLACHFYSSNTSSLPSTPGSCYSMNLIEDMTSKGSAPTAQYLNEIAKQELDHCLNTTSPRLDTVQTLLLLYKHDEIMGSSSDGIRYLELAQDMVKQLHSIVPQQQEMIIRARWMLFGCISLGNLSDNHFNRLYAQVDLPVELPQALKEEIEDGEQDTIVSSAHQHVNRFAQIANLSVLYSHTIQSMITRTTSHLICLQQFKEIRQHWHNSLHPVTQSRLISVCATDEEEIDILILYNAVLYDMLYLLLILHYHLESTEWDGVETAYRLQRMVYTWVLRTTFISAVQSRRMASFALMLCLQIQMAREEDKIDYEFVEQIRQTMKFTYVDPRIDNELSELYLQLTSKKSSHPITQPAMDYFSLIPQPLVHSTTSSPLDHPSSTPGLWDMLSTTTNGGLSTPIREEEAVNHGQTTEWIMEQQRQQEQQFQLYQSQQFQPIVTTTIPTTNDSHNIPLVSTPNNYNNNNHDSSSSTPYNEDYFYLNLNHSSSSQNNWSSTTIIDDNLNQMKI
jgi:hypothetical protein